MAINYLGGGRTPPTLATFRSGSQIGRRRPKKPDPEARRASLARTGITADVLKELIRQRKKLTPEGIASLKKSLGDTGGSSGGGSYTESRDPEERMRKRTSLMGEAEKQRIMRNARTDAIMARSRKANTFERKRVANRQKIEAGQKARADAGDLSAYPGTVNGMPTATLHGYGTKPQQAQLRGTIAAGQEGSRQTKRRVNKTGLQQAEAARSNIRGAAPYWNDQQKKLIAMRNAGISGQDATSGQSGAAVTDQEAGKVEMWRKLEAERFAQAGGPGYQQALQQGQATPEAIQDQINRSMAAFGYSQQQQAPAGFASGQQPLPTPPMLQDVGAATMADASMAAVGAFPSQFPRSPQGPFDTPGYLQQPQSAPPMQLPTVPVPVPQEPGMQGFAGDQGQAGVPGQPQGFDAWYAGHAQQWGLNPNPNDPRHQYDYRAAYDSGARADASGHLPSQFKAPGHPNRFVNGIDTITGQPQGVPSHQQEYPGATRGAERRQAYENPQRQLAAPAPTPPPAAPRLYAPGAVGPDYIDQLVRGTESPERWATGAVGPNYVPNAVVGNAVAQARSPQAAQAVASQIVPPPPPQAAPTAALSTAPQAAPQSAPTTLQAQTQQQRMAELWAEREKLLSTGPQYQQQVPGQAPAAAPGQGGGMFQQGPMSPEDKYRNDLLALERQKQAFNEKMGTKAMASGGGESTLNAEQMAAITSAAAALPDLSTSQWEDVLPPPLNLFVSGARGKGFKSDREAAIGARIPQVYIRIQSLLNSARATGVPDAPGFAASQIRGSKSYLTGTPEVQEKIEAIISEFMANAPVRPQ